MIYGIPSGLKEKKCLLPCETTNFLSTAGNRLLPGKSFISLYSRSLRMTREKTESPYKPSRDRGIREGASCTSSWLFKARMVSFLLPVSVDKPRWAG